MKIILFLAPLLLSTPVCAKNHLLLLGGSGDPPGNKTRFDSTAESLAKFAQVKNYSSTVAFNGEHPQTEVMLKQNFPQSEPFTEETFKRLINNHGEDVSKDENVIIFINSHGDSGSYPQSSHGIRCGQSHCNLDELNTLITRLEEEKNAKVTIIDASCYSGASVKLGSSKTCVLTSTRADSVGYTATNRLFAEELSSAKNMEELFLKTQAGFYGQGNINTSAGTKTRNLLNQFFKEFKNPEPQSGKLQLRNCDFDQNKSLKNLKLLKDQVRDITGKTEPEFKQLETALKEYQKRLDRAKDLIDSTKNLDNTPINPEDGFMTWSTLTNLSKENINEQISQLNEQLKQTTNPIGQKEISDQIALLGSIEQTKSNLRASNPQFVKYEKESLELNTLLSADTTDIPEGSILMAQFKILAPERSLYKKIYQTFKEPNPCSSFTI